jgi:hypothetical protein
VLAEHSVALILLKGCESITQECLSFTEQRQGLTQQEHRVTGVKYTLEGFDPGSERTLAAWIRHASRGNARKGGTGVRGSKAWVTYPGIWHSP